LPTIVFVRHGQASFGQASYDVLSDTGVRQAEHVAGVLQRQGVRIDRVLSGSMGRQRDTAAAIAAAFGTTAEVDARWNEYDADDILEHHSDTAVRQDRRPGAPAVSSREFQGIMERAVLRWLDAGPASGAHEPWPAFSGRVAAALEELGGALSTGEAAAVCTSGGVLAALAVQLLGVPAATLQPLNRVMVNVGITRVLIGRSGATLLSYNEQAHLTGVDRELLTYR
jgi:broad specificity phosphatase PhoE